MKLLALVVLLGLAARASTPEPLFDGSSRATLTFPPAPSAPPGVEASRKPTPVPDDLAQARGRVGNDAMLSRRTPLPPGSPFTVGVIGDDAALARLAEKAVNQWRALQAAGGLLSRDSSAGRRRSPRACRVVEREVTSAALRRNTNASQRRGRQESLRRGVRRALILRPRRLALRQPRLPDRGTGGLAWLKAALAVPGPKVIFTHVPPDYIKSITPLKEVGALEEWSTDKDAQDEQKGYLRDFFTNYFQDGASEFEDIVSNGGVKAVYMGHIHAFWAADHRGVRYIISGGGGSPLYPLPPGYPKKRFAHTLNIAVNPSGLVETVVPYKGKPFVLSPVKP